MKTIGSVIFVILLVVSQQATAGQDMFKGLNLQIKRTDPKYVKNAKRQLMSLKFEHINLEKRCRTDVKGYFTANCERVRDKLAKKSERLIIELGSAITPHKRTIAGTLKRGH